HQGGHRACARRSARKGARIRYRQLLGDAARPLCKHLDVELAAAEGQPAALDRGYQARRHAPARRARSRNQQAGVKKATRNEEDQMTLFDMTGKVAVITGSSRGIGCAIAERMAEHGAKVVISSRKKQACDEVAKAINDKAGKQVALPVAANISTKDDLKNLVEETNRAFGRIDALVCNAASNPYYGPQAGISDEQFRKILDNNIVSNHWLISLVVPQMIDRKDGSITVISSIGGLKGSTVLGAYAISKAADMQLARNLACEYGKHNIRVNCI